MGKLTPKLEANVINWYALQDVHLVRNANGNLCISGILEGELIELGVVDLFKASNNWKDYVKRNPELLMT